MTSDRLPLAIDTYWMADGLRVMLDSGRVLRVPPAYAPAVHTASEAERRLVCIANAGRNIEWPTLGIALSVADLIRATHTVLDPGPGETLPLDVTNREEDYT